MIIIINEIHFTLFEVISDVLPKQKHLFKVNISMLKVK